RNLKIRGLCKIDTPGSSPALENARPAKKKTSHFAAWRAAKKGFDYKFHNAIFAPHDFPTSQSPHHRAAVPALPSGGGHE
ncbi:MAG TPA: hypothetical protein VHM91_15040, partial [Verrucomicrobiales bacterium]|nr:hypothetical protein [Verrucomicrobiales bacterium]